MGIKNIPNEYMTPNASASRIEFAINIYNGFLN
jgi:hypothetical protein